MATLQNLNFIPTSIPGCSLWVDAADRTSLGLSGTNVNQWNDKSGNGRNLTTSAGTVTYSNNRLVFPSASIMSGPSMSFTGSIFIVAQPTGNTGSLNHFIGPTGGGLAIRYDSAYLLPNPGNDSDIGFGGAYVINGTQITVANPALNTQNNIVYTPIVNGFTGTFTISTTFLSRYFTGNMYEIIMYTTSLTALQRQQVEGYLAWKWGLVANLPAAHPYKLVGPNSAGLSYPSGLSVAIPTQSLSVSRSPLVFGFSPTSIPGCQLWFDAPDGNTITVSGSNVTQWRDKSANAQVLSQGTTLNQGTYITSPQNGLRVVSLSAGKTYTGGTLPVNGLTNMSIFAVVNNNTSQNPTPPTSGTGYSFLRWPETGAWGIVEVNALSGFVDWRFGTGQVNNYAYANFPTAAGSNYNLLMVSKAGTAEAAYQNGNLLSNYTAGSTTIANTSSAFFIGSSNATNNIGEIIVYTSALATSQRQQIEGYLAWKWGLQASLPANHPYKNLIPGLTVNVPIALYGFQAVSFTPRSISGLSLWLDAADNASLILSGSTVSQWNDKSGRNLSAGFNTILSNALPTYNSSGTPYVQLAAGQALLVNSWGYTTAWTCFVCLNSVTLAARWLLSPYSTVNLVMMGMNQGTNKIFANLLPSAGPDLTGNHIENTSASNTSISAPFNWYRDGTLQTTNTANAGVSANASAALGIGENATLSNASGGIYNIYEIVMYSTYLTPNQRQSIEGYLAWKWGMVGNLPATHPFKKFLPPPS